MKCFKHALEGLAYTIRTERNMRVHLCFMFYVVCAGLVTKISAAEWAVVVLCCGAVMAFEALNTALETLCDTLHPEKSLGIKLAKDASAAAVLCAALGAAAAGSIIFFQARKLEAFFIFLKEKPLIMGLIALTLVPAALFVAKKPGEKGKQK